MSLRDEVSVVPYRKRDYVHHMLREQGENPEEFEELLADETIQPESIWKMLNRREIDVATGTIHKWAAKARGR